MDTEVITLKSRRTMKQEAVQASLLIVGEKTILSHLKEVNSRLEKLENLKLEEFINKTNQKIEILEKEIQLLQKQMELIRLEYESSNLKEE